MFPQGPACHLTIVLNALQESVCDAASSFDLSASDLACCVDELQATLDTVQSGFGSPDFDLDVSCVLPLLSLVLPLLNALHVCCCWRL